MIDRSFVTVLATLLASAPGVAQGESEATVVVEDLGKSIVSVPYSVFEVAVGEQPGSAWVDGADSLVTQATMSVVEFEFGVEESVALPFVRCASVRAKPGGGFLLAGNSVGPDGAIFGTVVEVEANPLRVVQHTALSQKIEQAVIVGPTLVMYDDMTGVLHGCDYDPVLGPDPATCQELVLVGENPLRPDVGGEIFLEEGGNTLWLGTGRPSLYPTLLGRFPKWSLRPLQDRIWEAIPYTGSGPGTAPESSAWHYKSQGNAISVASNLPSDSGATVPSTLSITSVHGAQTVFSAADTSTTAVINDFFAQPGRSYVAVVEGDPLPIFVSSPRWGEPTSALDVSSSQILAHTSDWFVGSELPVLQSDIRLDHPTKSIESVVSALWIGTRDVDTGDYPVELLAGGNGEYLLEPLASIEGVVSHTDRGASVHAEHTLPDLQGLIGSVLLYQFVSLVTDTDGGTHVVLSDVIGLRVHENARVALGIDPWQTPIPDPDVLDAFLGCNPDGSPGEEHASDIESMKCRCDL